MANKSSNKNAKSNKTAHVLNLLSGAGAAEAPRQQNGQNHAPAAPAAPAHDDGEAVSEAIRSALEEDLMAQLEAEPAPQPQEDFQPFQPEAVAPPAAPSEPEPAPIPPQPETLPEPAAAVQPEPAPARPEPEPQAAAVSPAEPQPEPQPDPHDLMEDVTYINVMQALVEDKVDKFMQRFKMCTCTRCRTDVIALTLSSLPAKYIVVPESEGIPMLSVYEGRYDSAVTAQLMWACQKVSAHPRHSANNDASMRLGAPRKEE